MNILWAVDACEAVESDSSVGGLPCTRSPTANSIAMARFTRQKQKIKTSWLCFGRNNIDEACHWQPPVFSELFVKMMLMNLEWMWAEQFWEAKKKGEGDQNKLNRNLLLINVVKLNRKEREREASERWPRTARTCKRFSYNVAHSGIYFTSFCFLFLRHSLVRSPAVSLCEKNNENHGPRVH